MNNPKPSIKILAVDDEPSILRLIQVSLNRQGYEVDLAADGREALDRVSEEKPDLIIMDVMMPHVDGFEAIRQLKSEDATRDIPVILLTAKRHDADLIQGMNSGAVSYLTKPFAPNALITLVEQIVGNESEP